MSQDMVIIKKCNSTYPTDKLILNLVLVHKNFNNDVIVVDNNFKCFIYCLYYNYGWMNEKGNFKYQARGTNLSIDHSRILIHIPVVCADI